MPKSPVPEWTRADAETTLNDYLAPEGFKQCRRCGEVKPLTEFHKASHNWKGDGRRSSCKACRYKPVPDYEAAAEQVRPYLADRVEYDDEEAVAASADRKPRTKPPPVPNYAPEPRTKPEPEPEPSTLRRTSPTWSRPSPNPADMPRYVDHATARTKVIDRLGDMDPAERQEEMRVARIYGGDSRMPAYLREAMREGRY